MSEQLRSAEGINLQEAGANIQAARHLRSAAKDRLEEARITFKQTEQLLSQAFEDVKGSRVNLTGRPSTHTQIFTNEAGEKTATTVSSYGMHDDIREPREYINCELMGVESSRFFDISSTGLVVGGEDWYDVIPLGSIYNFELAEPNIEEK